VLDLLDQALEPVEQARIALQSGDRQAAVEAVKDARGIAGRLKSTSEQLTAANEAGG
jgi:hypothetical protein